MLKRMILMLIVSTLIFGGIFAYKAVGNHFMNQFFDNMPIPPVTVTASEVTTDEWQPFISAIGSFVAVNSTDLTTEASGIINGIHFANGSNIKKGTLLVTLDDSVDRAELKRLQAVEELANIELTRYQRLFREKNVSESELRRSESEAKQASAAVESQRARIAQKTILAPFDGIAGLRQVSLGQLLSPGSVVVSLQSFAPIYLNFTLPEQQLANIRLGESVQVNVDSVAGRVFTGKITAIAPSVREASRSIEVQATLDNQDLALRPGMFARVQLDTGKPRSVSLIPQTAIQFNPYGNSVFVIEEQDDKLVVQQRFVQTGERRGDLIAVEQGLEVGDRIVTSGLLKLRNGSQIIISDNPRVQPSAEVNPSPANQ
ncbi:efflux RND transporter periplasmic adaptor subunit [Vibrio metschnikovii]|nr:efflux RND transporter periplasmic adaptor subunit [Vibrio metschnikovii]